MNGQQGAFIIRHLDAEIDASLHAELIPHKAFDQRLGQRKICRPEPGLHVQAVENGEPECIQILDANPLVDRVEQAVGVIGEFQTEMIGRQFSGTRPNTRQAR